MRRIWGVLAMAALVSFGTQAQAAQFLYTVSGYVTGDEYTYDEWHVFDPAQGDAFTATYLVDDAAPQSVYTYGATGSAAIGGGATELGTRSPLIASLTIGSRSYEIRRGDYHSYPTIDPSTGDPIGPTDIVDELGLAAKDASLHQLTLASTYGESHSCCFPHPNDTYGQNEGLDFTLYSAAFTGPDFRQTGTFTLQPGSFGEFFKSETIIASPGALTSIFLAPTTLTVTPLSAVPEIGTWLMMILGVGWVGFALRRSCGLTGSVLLPAG